MANDTMRAEAGAGGVAPGAEWTAERVGERESMAERAVERAKFDVGTPPEVEATRLPWGYGRDRVTVLVRSPHAIYVYWEITDEGIARARARLGPNGAHGFCNLRVYDTTGRDFDGTNANGYVDIGVDRRERERFLRIDRPGSSVHVEIGVMSHEGYFQPIARSARGDIPRDAPSPDASVEWMTVPDGSGVPAARPFVSRYRGPVVDPLAPRAEASFDESAWGLRLEAAGDHFHDEGERAHAWTEPTGGLVEHAWVEASHWETFEVLGAWERSWSFSLEGEDASRFAHEWAEAIARVLDGHWGPVRVHGAWHVAMERFERGPRRVFGRWMAQGARIEPLVFERWGLGGSERWRAGASAWMHLGASEAFAWAASRMARGGASALLFRGASERRAMGASERRAWGQSGRGAMGASERFAMGASERRAGGSSLAWRT